MVAVAEVREALLTILADPAERNALLGGSQSGAMDDRLSSLEGQIGAMMQDRSFGGIMGGAQWISGISVVNGTITAAKLSVTELAAVTANTGTLNVTGIFTAAAAFPATGARVEISSSGIWGYSGAVTTTFKFNVDGSGSIGSGATQITWTTGGVVTVPVATIGSLTIAAVGGGVLGGTYQTATTGAHINLSTTGIEAYNATSEIAANRTFQLLAATGAMTATGSFTIQSASSGTRVVVSSAGGIEGYNGTTQTFLLNAATGAGQLGPTTGGNYISWSSTGVTIGGVAMSGGKIVASAISTTTLAAIQSDLGTITAGTINAASITVTNLSFTHMQAAGTLGTAQTLGALLSVGSEIRFTSASAKIRTSATKDYGDTEAGFIIEYGTAGTDARMEFTTASNTRFLRWTGTDLSMRGKLQWGSTGQHYVDENVMHFGATASDTAYIEFLSADATPGSAQIQAVTTTNLGSLRVVASGIGSRAAVLSGEATNADSTTMAQIRANKSGGAIGAGHQVYADGKHEFYVDFGSVAMALARTNRALSLYGYLYPGSGSATQTTMYLVADATNGWTTVNTNTGTGAAARINEKLGGTGGSEYWQVLDSAGAHQFGIDSNGNLMTVQNDTGALGTYYGRLVISVDQGGTPTSKYIPLYNAP